MTIQGVVAVPHAHTSGYKKAGVLMPPVHVPRYTYRSMYLAPSELDVLLDSDVIGILLSQPICSAFAAKLPKFQLV
jgi:hypothetical protein